MKAAGTSGADEPLAHGDSPKELSMTMPKTKAAFPLVALKDFTCGQVCGVPAGSSWALSQPADPKIMQKSCHWALKQFVASRLTPR